MKAAKDPSAAIQFAAERSNKVWIQREMIPIMNNLGDPVVMRRLGMGALGVQCSKLPEEQVSNASLFFKLSVNMASYRAWYMLTYVEVAPDMFVGILDENNADSLQCMARLKDTAEMLIEAEAAVLDPHHEDRLVPYQISTWCFYVVLSNAS